MGTEGTGNENDLYAVVDGELESSELSMDSMASLVIDGSASAATMKKDWNVT